MRLHQWDVLRANKAPFAFGLEPRVPFLDKTFLELVMNIDPQEKMVRRAAPVLLTPGPLWSSVTQGTLWHGAISFLHDGARRAVQRALTAWRERILILILRGSPAELAISSSTCGGHALLTAAASCMHAGALGEGKGNVTHATLNPKP